MNNQFGTVIVCLTISALMILLFKTGFKELANKDRSLNILIITSFIIVWIFIAYSIFMAQSVVNATATWL